MHEKELSALKQEPEKTEKSVNFNRAQRRLIERETKKAELKARQKGKNNG